MSSPAVSVVTPCRNERDHIEACLRSALAQEEPQGGFEVIVADGMSDDGTREIIQRLAATDPRLRMLDNPGRITPCGLNAGIREARGRYICIMGAHSRYAPNYLKNCLEVAAATATENVGGVALCEGYSYVQRAAAAAHHSAFSVGGARWHKPEYEGFVDTVFGGFYQREVFARMGLFDEEFVRNQDDEFNLRLTRAGGRIWQSPRIRSWYTPRGSLRDLFRQYFQYGYWKVRVIQKHRLPASPRHLVPGIFVLGLALGWLVGFLHPIMWLLYGGAVALYLLLSLVFSVATAARAGWSLLPVLPVIFLTYHLSYGSGFLLGVWDFVLLRKRTHRAACGALTRS
jgi:glycosyltransferase involved in cell wall biosynthesis